MTLLDSSLLDYTLPCGSTQLYSTTHSTMAVHDSTKLYCGSTVFYFTPLHATIVLLDSTALCLDSAWLYLAVLHSTMALLNSTLLYHTLQWLYFTLLHSTMAPLESTTLNHTSSILGHALLKAVENLWLQHFDVAVITFIRQEKTPVSSTVESGY